MTTLERDGRRRRERAATSRRRARDLKPTSARLSYGGARFGRFCWRYLRQTKGSTDPLGLVIYQLDVFSEMLKVERDAWRTVTVRDLRDPERFWERTVPAWMEQAQGRVRGLRVYREALLGVPKKNGKSTAGSGLALYMLMADGEDGAEVYSTASKKDQARIVGRQAREMVEASPKLMERLRLYRDMIEHPESSSFYKVVSADAPGLEGINPHHVANDEVHAHPNRELYDVLRTASIQRAQPLLASYTTAGVKIDGTIAGELYLRGAGTLGRKREPKIKGGQVVGRKDKQRSFYFRWYQVPWRDRESLDAYEQANPAPFITRAKLLEEMEVDRPRAIFYRYHGNMWTRVEEHWLKPGAWDACEDGRLKLERNDPVVLGVDIGLRYDTTAITIAKPSPYAGADRVTEDGKAVGPHGADDRIILRAWSAGVWPDPKRPAPTAHEVLQNETELRLAYVLAKILDLAETFDVIAVGADPYKFTDQLQTLEDMGFVAIRFEQTNARMVPASEGLYRVVSQRVLAHDGDEVYGAQIDAAVARDVGGGHWRLDKRRALEVMDLAISTAIAVDLAENPDVVQRNRPSLTLL